MEFLCTIIDQTIVWIGEQGTVPVTFASEDHIPVQTDCRPYLEFGYHSAGDEAELRVGEAEAVSRPGCLSVLNAHFGNSGRPQGRWSYWCLSLDTALSAPFPSLATKPLLATVQLDNHRRIVQRYEAVERQYRARTGLHELRLKCEVLLFLAEVRESIAGGAGLAPPLTHGCEAAVAYLHERFRSADVTLAHVAAAAGLSAPHLCRLFRNQLEISPMKYLHRLRMDHARDLLRRTSQNVSQVAYAVGYRDPLHFSRTFRAYTGLSPRQFRQQ
ncbi:MAG: helix-turn-helix transcriptional regulator [Lentisphaeria bacterium]|nr:helix-turn-helix transcriptional regulator [Lentisphaeria bacterium]